MRLGGLSLRGTKIIVNWFFARDKDNFRKTEPEQFQSPDNGEPKGVQRPLTQRDARIDAAEATVRKAESQFT